MAHSCVCGFAAKTAFALREHHRGCKPWHDQLGQCPVCKRRHYRHWKDCTNVGEEDEHRQRLIRKHGLDPELFERVLRVMAKRYRSLAGVRTLDG